MRHSLLLGLLLVWSCSAPAPQGEIKQHMQRSQHLYALINDIDNVVFERTFSELEKDTLRVHYAWQFNEEIDALLKDLHSDESYFYKNEKNPKLTQVYHSIIDLLQRNNDELGKAIQVFKPETVIPLIHNTLNLCNACHSNFRDRP